MIEPLALLLSFVVLVACAIVQPHRAQCPIGWYASGVRPSGSFVCVQTPPRALCDTKAGCGPGEQAPDPRVSARIYCTGGSVPIVGLDARTVACEAVH